MSRSVPRVADLLEEARSLVRSGMHDREAAAKVLAPVDLHNLAVTDYDGLMRLVYIGLDVELNRISSRSRTAGQTEAAPETVSVTASAQQSLEPVMLTVRVLDFEYDIPRGKVVVREMTPEEGLELAASMRRDGLGKVVRAKQIREVALKAKAAGVERIGDLFEVAA